MKLLMISAFFPAHGGGVEVVAAQLTSRMAASGVLVHWIAGGVPSEKPQEELGLTLEQASSVDFLEQRVGLPMPIWGLKSLSQVWKKIRTVDVVHVHDYLYFSSIATILFTIFARKPLVITQHIGEIPFKSKLARIFLAILNKTIGRLALGYANQVVFVGQPVMTYFGEFVRFHAPPLIISNGVDHNKYKPILREPEHDRPIRLLFVGRFVEKKGIDLLKSCMNLPSVEWTFIGWGPLNPRHWPFFPTNAVVFENLRAEQLIPYFQNADLLVLPSTGEGFPLVLQEALACGTPVLVSKEVADAFPVKDAGCVFDVEVRVDNPEQILCEALEKIINNRYLLENARKKASKLAEQWSWDSCVSQYKKIYQNIAGGKFENFNDV